MKLGNGSKDIGIFEVALVELPTQEALGKGAVARLILAPKAYLAVSRSAAVLLAAKDVTETYDPQRLETLVRRFKGNTAGEGCGYDD
jgi:hypothetical protein